MKTKYPGTLWLLPLLLGIFGGIAAALIADIKYHASWWELFVVGLIMSVLSFISLLVIAPYMVL